MNPNDVNPPSPSSALRVALETSIANIRARDARLHADASEILAQQDADEQSASNAQFAAEFVELEARLGNDRILHGTPRDREIEATLRALRRAGRDSDPDTQREFEVIGNELVEGAVTLDEDEPERTPECDFDIDEGEQTDSYTYIDDIAIMNYDALRQQSEREGR